MPIAGCSLTLAYRWCSHLANDFEVTSALLPLRSPLTSGFDLQAPTCGFPVVFRSRLTKALKCTSLTASQSRVDAIINILPRLISLFLSFGNISTRLRNKICHRLHHRSATTTKPCGDSRVVTAEREATTPAFSRTCSR